MTDKDKAEGASGKSETLQDAPVKPTQAKPAGGVAAPDMGKLGDEEEAIYRVAAATKADVLFKWRDEERAREGGARKAVLDAIEQRLLNVHGAPLRP